MKKLGTVGILVVVAAIIVVVFIYMNNKKKKAASVAAAAVKTAQAPVNAVETQPAPAMGGMSAQTFYGCI
jgi:uncharacterized protein YpmB